jgi:hypothetical protein
MAKKTRSAGAQPKLVAPAVVPDLPPAARRALDRIIARLTASLGASKAATAAVSHQTLSKDQDPMASALTGPVLMLIPYAEVRYGELSDKYRQFFQASLDGGVPLHQVEVRFARQADRSWAHTVALETVENFTRRTKAKKAIDEEIRSALVAFVDTAKSDWQSVCLNYEDRANAKRPGLCVIVAYPRPLVDLVPDAALQAAFGKLMALYQVFGRTLETATWRVEKARPAKVSADSYYG